MTSRMISQQNIGQNTQVVKQQPVITQRISKSLCFGLAIMQHLLCVGATDKESGLLPSQILSNYRMELSKNMLCDKPPEWQHATRHIDKLSNRRTSGRYPASLIAATVDVSSPQKTILGPSRNFADSGDIDADFDRSFIDNILKDQGVIPSSTTTTATPPIRNSNLADEPELPPDLPEAVEDDAVFEDNPQTHGEQRLPHSPVIFRYYGKSRSRTRASGSIPFILLGPDIDHWRTTGEHLAARGFSVIACERDPFEHEEDGNNLQKDDESNCDEMEWWKGTENEGANLILNVLQASRWSKVILVACDSEAVIAIQAAMKLAPDKIAGVVLCGDLQEVDACLLQSHPHLRSQQGDFAVDAFLRAHLPCPFAIAWDGEKLTDIPPLATPSDFEGSSPAECLHGNRCLILGGGIAPHRRQPETFSWTLTRFVEDKVAPSIPISEQRKLFRRVKKVHKDGGGGSSLPAALAGVKHAFSTSFLRGDYFSTGSFVVYGRVAASALLYASMLRVGIFQYSNLLDGMLNVKSGYDGVQRIRRKALGFAAGFIVNFGYIPLLFKRKSGVEEQDVTDFTDFQGPQDFDPDNSVEEETECAPESEDDEAVEESIDEDASEDEALEESTDEENKEERRPLQPIFLLDLLNA